MNYLYLGDCLDILKTYIKTKSIDLVYIDPPFNSKKKYNVFIGDKKDKYKKVAFEDTWSLRNIQDSLSDLNNIKMEKLKNLLLTYQEIAPFAFPYLVMMALRSIVLPVLGAATTIPL
jgi:DNA modification methylase